MRQKESPKHVMSGQKGPVGFCSWLYDSQFSRALAPGFIWEDRARNWANQKLNPLSAKAKRFIELGA